MNDENKTIMGMKKEKSNDKVLRVNNDEFEKGKNQYIVYYKGIPFTGISYGLYSNGNLWYESEMSNGIEHGTSTQFKKDGSIHSVIIYSEGKVPDEDDEIYVKYVRYMVKTLFDIREDKRNKEEELKKPKVVIENTNTDLDEDEFEYKRTNSKNVKKNILSVFKQKKINNFYFRFDWRPDEGFNLDDIEWGDDEGEWGIEMYNKYEENIVDVLDEFFDLSDYFQNDGYCYLELKDSELTFSIEEDTENNEVNFNWEKGELEEVPFPEDYKKVYIKWEITDKGIIDLNK